VPCFNECCRDLTQLLTPYDILRLKDFLGLTSGQFLAAYTAQHIGPESGLPIISLKPANPEEQTCPFVTPGGCSVYECRPSSCRTYPLMRGVSRSRESGKITEHFAVLKEKHCRGFEQPRRQTVRQWMDEQGVNACNEINDKMLQILTLKNTRMPGTLDLKSRHLFFTALYDLDSFRSQIIKNDLLADLKMDDGLADKALEGDDLALLEAGMLWVEKVLFD
jgi:hypothetical protein